MYAIVDIAGQQFKVEKNQKLYVHRLDAKEGESLTFDKVLLVDEDGKVSIGSPVVNGTVVSAKVVGHLKGDKVIVFKKKRRKGYQKSNGHRQYLTELLIEGIGAGKASAKKETAKEAPAKEADKQVENKEAAPKAAAKKPAAKKPAAKKTTAASAEKKAAPKKPAAKKAEPKKEAEPKKDETAE